MHCLLLLRPTSNIVQTVKDAAQKFAGVHEVKIEIDTAKNAIEMAKFFDQGRRYGAVVIANDIEEVEINYILNLYYDIKKKPPLLLSHFNYERFAGKSKKIDLTPVIYDFTKDFVFDYLKETLVLAEKKIDVRIIREVIHAVTNNIFERTQMRVEVVSLSEIQNKESAQEMSSTIAFIGDGLIGTMSIATTNNLVNLLAERILGCTPEECDEAKRADVLSKLTLQIHKTFCGKIAQDGYELQESMQIVTASAINHTLRAKTNGYLYSVKFKHGDDEMYLTVAYGSYKKPKGTPNFPRDGFVNRYLDVRILNGVIQGAMEALELGGKRPVKISSEVQKQRSYETESLHLIHGRGHNGSFIIALDIPKETIGFIIQESLAISQETLTTEIINDVSSGLISQITGSLQKKMLALGYDYVNVFSASYCADERLSYLLKNPGRYCRLNFLFEDRPFSLLFGMEKGSINKMFDAWPHIKNETPDGGIGKLLDTIR